MCANRYFIKPPLELYTREGDSYSEGFSTYSQYNYLRPGIASYIRRRHFEAALVCTREHFHRCGAIDFGCADGVFLPSLSRHFVRAVGIENQRDFIKVARRVAVELKLGNVRVIDNGGMPFELLADQIRGKGYGIAFLLEVLEHVGEQGDLYGPKIELLHKVSDLLDNPGRVVISVPNMVGLSFLAQRVGFALLGVSREEISFRNLLKATFLRDTSALEAQWHEMKHLGFNHLILERQMGKEFNILRKRSLFFQTLYAITR